MPVGSKSTTDKDVVDLVVRLVVQQIQVVEFGLYSQLQRRLSDSAV